MAFDLVFRNAEVIPGDGPSRQVDVGVVGDRIVALGPGLGTDAAEVVECGELMLCPGFIDLHAHSALEPFRDPLLLPKVAQGFTTELINPDGLAPAPVAAGRVEERRAYLRALEGPGPERWDWQTFPEYLEALQRTRPTTSLIPSVGHNAVRDLVMGGERRRPRPEELEHMLAEVREGLEAGGRTLSFGLIYLPGMYADTEELVQLAREAARVNAPLMPHVRNEADRVVESVGEFIEIARRTGAPLHISHLKVVGNEHLVDRLLESIDAASKDVDISFDQYPYGAGSTMLTALLPPWAQEGGPPAILQRLRNRSQRRRMATDMQRGLDGWENLYHACGPDGIVVVHAGGGRAADVGKNLLQMGEERGLDPLSVTFDLLVDTGLDAAMVDHYAEEATVRTIFRHRLALVGSDGIFGAHPHPRLYGTAARVLGRYALREGLVTVGEAVGRLTYRAAKRLGLSDRGRIAEGLRADLVLIDPRRLLDTATFENPASVPEGVVRVLVAGCTVWRDGGHTGARPGGVMRSDRRLVR